VLSLSLVHLASLCFGRSFHLLAAFHVTPDDSRVMLRELTHSSTVVLYASYSVVMNASDYSLFAANFGPQSGNPNQYFINNITDAITDGLKHLLPAHPGSVFSFSLDFQAQPHYTSHSNQIIVEGSVLVFALNATEPLTYVGWSDLAIAAFQSKAPPAIQHRNIFSPQNFKAS
jgi:hypothetical protein